MLSYLIVHGLFWALLLIGFNDIGRRACTIYLGLWLVGYVGSSWFSAGVYAFMAYVAILDIALVLHVFQGDVTLR